MEWEYLFPRHILERGFHYYLEDRVSDLIFTEKKIEAVVEGSDDYRVKILIGDDGIMNMSCSCPYASDGTPCKHMAAVLYEHENADEQNGTDSSGQSNDAGNTAASGASDEPAIDDMVASADEGLVRSFLLEALKHDEKLALRFRSLCSPAISAADMEKYRKQVNQLILRYQGRGGFIDYRSASPFMNEIIGAMNDALESMMDNRCYSAAFELAAYTFIQVSDVDMDDSGGELSWFAQECEEWWERILNEAEQSGDVKVQEIMYNWFTGHLDGSITVFMEEHVESFLESHFNH